MKKLYVSYIESFSGLSTEIWWLALITLINRAGTMVIPFLSIYLTEDLHLSMGNQVAWIMSCFGLGSLVGTWLGGKLTDRIGYYKIMVFSLLATGFFFIGLQYLKTFEFLCIGIFLTMCVADMFRPASFVAMSAYSKPENKTRSVTLIRLAINLGFSAGPAVGGLIITHLNYSGLFWVDGITCILATFVLLKVLHPKKAKIQDEIKHIKPESAYRDFPFVVFFIAMVLFSIVFFQYFSVMPIYYREAHQLSELQVGLILGGNGLFIFLLEMPLIKWLERTKNTKVGLVLFGVFLTGLSILVLNFTNWSGILILGILLMTIGEMIAFPFAHGFALDRAKRGNQGEFMAMYAMAFSVGSIFGHNAGLQLAEKLGFNTTWSIMSALAGVCVILLFILKLYMTKKPITSNA